MDIPKRCTAQANSCRHITQPAVHQHYIRSVNGHIRSGPDRNTDICPGQCRRIIDTVTDHGNLALLLKISNDTFLPFREYLRNDFVHTGLHSDRLRGPLIVSRQHNYTDAHILQFMHCLWTVFLNNICHCNNAGKSLVTHKQQRSFALLCKLFRLFRQFFRHICLIPDISETPAKNHRSVRMGFHTVTGKRFKIRHRLCADIP